MRVLLSSTAGHGHVFPLVPLAQALLEAGHDVVWATQAHGRDLVEGAGIAWQRAGLDGPELGALMASLRDRAEQLPGPERAAFMFPTMFGESLSPPMARDLLPLAQEWRPDLLVQDSSQLAGPLVAAVLGVPSVTHSFGGAVPGPFVEEAGRRLAGLWAEHGLTVPPFAGCYDHLWIDICPPSVQPVPIDHITRRQALRPVTYSGPPAEDPPLSDAPLVYLTLGTVQNHQPVLAVAVAALAALPVQLLVTVGPDGNVQALGEQPPNVLVRRYVPQAQVLPRCAVVVSHAGSGTHLGALASGVPQLALPQAADQFRNAQAAAAAGAGLVLMPAEATGEAIAAGVRRLLDEPAFRQAAARVAAEISAMPAPAEVVPVLEALGTSAPRRTS